MPSGSRTWKSVPPQGCLVGVWANSTPRFLNSSNSRLNVGNLDRGQDQRDLTSGKFGEVRLVRRSEDAGTLRRARPNRKTAARHTGSRSRSRASPEKMALAGTSRTNRIGTAGFKTTSLIDISCRSRLRPPPSNSPEPRTLPTTPPPPISGTTTSRPIPPCPRRTCPASGRAGRRSCSGRARPSRT